MIGTPRERVDASLWFMNERGADAAARGGLAILPLRGYLRRWALESRIQRKQAALRITRLIDALPDPVLTPESGLTDSALFAEAGPYGVPVGCNNGGDIPDDGATVGSLPAPAPAEIEGVVQGRLDRVGR